MTGAAAGAVQALSVLLPTAEQALFLKACLRPDAEVAAAVRRWGNPSPSKPSAPAALALADRSMLPLLHRSLSESGVDVQPKLTSLLRTARAHEKLRAERYRGAVGEVLATLRGAAVEVLVLPGAGLVDRAYRDWSLRHSHDLDLLVRPGQWSSARQALSAACHSVDQRDWRGEPAELLAHHRTGLPIAVHARLLRNRYYGCSADDALELSEGGRVAGVETRVLGPEAALGYVLAQAGGASPRSLRWAADVWFLAEAGIEWGAARATIRRLRASLPAAVLVGWLHDSMGLECGEHTAHGLPADAKELGRVAEDAALSDAIGLGGGTAVGALRQLGSGRARAALAARMAFPDRRYVAAVERRPRPLAGAYARRFLRHARGVGLRVRGACREPHRLRR